MDAGKVRGGLGAKREKLGGVGVCERVATTNFTNGHEDFSNVSVRGGPGERAGEGRRAWR
jgi:hypothetical protein